MRFRVGLYFVALAALCGSSALADDISAAARGVVRVIAISHDYLDEENSSIAFGSGFAISPHRIVTNAHVVQAVRNPYSESMVAIVPAEGTRPLPGRLVAYDRTRDLAVVDIGSARVEPLTIYSGPVASGDHSAALGYPGNVDLATARSIDDLIAPSSPVRSEGNVSSERSVDNLRALLHTAAISRGNSGGPLVDQCGRVLGVNTFITNSGFGDAPFGFAVVSQELMSFLRENGQSFQQIGTACLTYAELLEHERVANETAARQQALKDQQLAAQQQQRVETAKAQAQNSRDNHTAAAALLSIIALITAGIGIALFLKDRERTAAATALVAVLSLVSATYAFITRPSLDVRLPSPILPANTRPPLAGQLTCRIESARSRITVSSADDLPIHWGDDGCMNRKTQYVKVAGLWVRALVPNGTETVYLQEFDPTIGQYVSSRYHLPQTEMGHLREIRGNTSEKICNSNSDTLSHLEDITKLIRASLPPEPNEKLVYTCSVGN